MPLSIVVKHEGREALSTFREIARHARKHVRLTAYKQIMQNPDKTTNPN